MTAVLAVSKAQFRILRRDPWFLIIMFVMPLVLMPMLKQTMGVSLQSSGFAGANGAEQVVPGQVVMFSFFVAGSTAFSVFREHGWNTWDRLRASATTPSALLAGFALPWIVIHVGYQGALYLVGGRLLGLRPPLSAVPVIIVLLIAYSLCVVSLILLITATFRTVAQVSGFQNVGAMVFGGLGGAMVPFDQVPGWAQAIAPVTPAYWAMRAHKGVLLEGAGITDVAVDVAVLVGASVLLATVAIRRFRVDETKEFFA